MMRIGIVTMVLALFALPASASDYSDRDDNGRRYAKVQRERVRYDRQLERLRGLAVDLAGEVSRLHRRAEAAAHHGDRVEARALHTLHELNERAQHFCDRLAERRVNVYHARKDLDRLERAVRKARHQFDGLHANGAIRWQFYRVAYLMHQIDSVSDYALAAHHGYRHHPRQAWNFRYAWLGR